MISAFIITKNEEANIADCIRSLDFVDEILVVDAESSDRTPEIASDLGARVVTRAWSGYSDQRNFAIARCTGDWILYMDADERPGPGFGEEIHAVAADSECAFDAFFVNSREYFWGGFLHYGGFGLHQANRKVRLWRRGTAEFVGNVHERAQVVGRIGSFRSFIDHYSTSATVRGLQEKWNRYSDIEAETALAGGAQASIRRLLWRPARTFMSRYVKHQGWRDGLRGLVVSMLIAEYFFLIEAKILESQITTVPKRP